MSDPRVDILERRVEMLEALVLQLQRAQPSQYIPTPEGMPALSPQRPGSSIPENHPPAAPPDPSWVPIIHRFARSIPGTPPPCGYAGVYLTEPPQEHRNADLSLMRIRAPGESAWREPQRGVDEPRCSSCLAPIDPFSNADLDYLSEMLPAPEAGKPKPARGRRRSGGGGRSVPSQTDHPEGVSPGLPDAASLLTFPDHTPTATFDVMQDLDALKRLADDSGLFDDRHSQ